MKPSEKGCSVDWRLKSMGVSGKMVVIMVPDIKSVQTEVDKNKTFVKNRVDEGRMDGVIHKALNPQKI